jgi:hypothetical protein
MAAAPVKTARSATPRRAVTRGLALAAAWACLLAAPAVAGADLVAPPPSPSPAQSASPAAAAPSASAAASTTSGGRTVALAIAGVAVVAVAVGAFAGLRRLSPQRGGVGPAVDGGPPSEAAAPTDDEAGG